MVRMESYRNYQPLQCNGVGTPKVPGGKNKHCSFPKLRSLLYDLQLAGRLQRQPKLGFFQFLFRNIGVRESKGRIEVSGGSGRGPLWIFPCQRFFAPTSTNLEPAAARGRDNFHTSSRRNAPPGLIYCVTSCTTPDLCARLPCGG